MVWTRIEPRALAGAVWYGLLSNICPDLCRFGMDLYLTFVRAFRGPVVRALERASYSKLVITKGKLRKFQALDGAAVPSAACFSE